MLYDEYRVSLFKKKIRAVLPSMEDLRFGRSKGRCHLIIDVSWRYQRDRSEEIGAYVMDRLKSSGIEAIVERDKYRLYRNYGHPKSEWPLDYIRIPIDQAALPERRRKVHA